MKNTILLLLSVFLVMTSCKDDDPVEVLTLQYDGANVTAPYLDAGVHEAGARFRADRTGIHEGKFLDEVELYLFELPEKCEVRVYGPGSSTTPGTLLYSQDVTNSMTSSSWNRHELSTPVEIEGNDLWIVIRLEHTSSTTSIGCDAGPTNPNGDWLFSDSDNTWLTFRERTNQEVSINWNIRGHIGE